MRKNQIVVVASFAAAFAVTAAQVQAEAVVGQSAPAFEGTDTDGKTHSLASFAGKHVVLEWFNPECPFVKKHYDSGTMQKLQKTFTGKGVVWLTVASSAPGKQGHLDAESGKAVLAKAKASPTALLLDPTGAIGKAYGAKTTPHMFVVNPEGKVIYVGGIDDRPSTDQADLEGAKAYVAAALDEALAGKPITTPTSQPYGCSVKYSR